MAGSVGGRGGIKSEINVTPLVDVVLVLLIIFMVVTPMLQRGKDVNLPKARQTEEAKGTDPLVLSVTREKTVWVESNLVDENALEKAVADAVRREPGRRLLVKGDDALKMGDVRRVMRRAHQGGARGVALAVQEKKP